MKNLLLIFFILSHCFALQSQELYSTFTFKEDQIRVIESFPFNEGDYVLAYQYHPMDTLNVQEAIIVELLEGGEMQTRKNLGIVRAGWNTAFEDEGQLVVAGQTDTSIWLKLLNTTFDIIAEKEFGLANDAGVFLTKKVLAFKDSYIFAGDSDGLAGEESALMIKVNKEDLEVTKQTTLFVVNNPVDLNDVEIFKGDSLIQLVSSPDDDPQMKIARFQIKDDALSTTRTIQTEFPTKQTEFEILNDEQLVFQTFPLTVQSIDMQGEALWAFKLTDLSFEWLFLSASIEEIRKDQNGDILVCGHIVREAPDDGLIPVAFIVKLSKSGELLWKRVFRPIVDESELYTSFYSVIPLEECYLFTGNSFTRPGDSNYGWVLKLNLDGCLEGDDCPEEQVLSTQAFDNIRTDLFRVKSSANTIQLDVMTHDQIRFSFYSIRGKKIMATETLQRGVHSLPLDFQNEIFIVVGTTDTGYIQSEKIWIGY